MGCDPTGHWDWGWEDQANLGVAVLLTGLAILLAAPTGGASLGGLAIGISTLTAVGGAAAATGTIMVGDAMAQATVNYAKKSKKSGKERATDKPSWVNERDVDLGQSSQKNANDLLNNKYGSGNWNKGPGTEFNRIVKWIDRSLRVVVFLLVDYIAEEQT